MCIRDRYLKKVANEFYGVEKLTEIRVINSAEIYTLLEQKSKKKLFFSLIPGFTIICDRQTILFTKEASFSVDGCVCVNKCHVFVNNN